MFGGKSRFTVSSTKTKGTNPWHVHYVSLTKTSHFTKYLLFVFFEWFLEVSWSSSRNFSCRQRRGVEAQLKLRHRCAWLVNDSLWSHQYPLYRRFSGPPGRSGRCGDITLPPPSFEIWNDQTVVQSLYPLSCTASSIFIRSGCLHNNVISLVFIMEHILFSVGSPRDVDEI
jgi:hypothetical protein